MLLQLNEQLLFVLAFPSGRQVALLPLVVVTEMATMKALILSGRPEAIEDLLDTMRKSEGTELLTNTYGGGNVQRDKHIPYADEHGLFRGTSPIMHAAVRGHKEMFSAVLIAMKAKQVISPRPVQFVFQSGA